MLGLSMTIGSCEEYGAGKESVLLLKGSYSVSSNYYLAINTGPVLLDLIFQDKMKIKIFK